MKQIGWFDADLQLRLGPRLIFIIVGLLILGGGRAAPATAHSELVAAVPPPGAVLEAPPAEIRLTFSQPLAPGSSFQLLDQAFRPVPGITPAVDPEQPTQMAATVPEFEPGAYTVQWISMGSDGHPLQGSYSFTLLAGPSGDRRFLSSSLLLGAGLALLAALAWSYRRRRQG